MGEEYEKVYVTDNKVFKSWITHLIKIIALEQAGQAIYHFWVVRQGNNWCQEILTNVEEHQVQQDTSFTGNILSLCDVKGRNQKKSYRKRWKTTNTD